LSLLKDFFLTSKIGSATGRSYEGMEAEPKKTRNVQPIADRVAQHLEIMTLA